MFETATKRFDVDRCVKEDGRKCEAWDRSQSKWRPACYIESDSTVQHAVSWLFNARLTLVSPVQIRNVQPKPRTANVTVFESVDGHRFLNVVGSENVPVRRDIGTVTINLDTCEQVTPADGVMTADELWENHRIRAFLMPGYDTYGVVHRDEAGKQKLWGGRVFSYEFGATYPTELAARKEATRIVGEGLHNA